jgi:hypothetical protein
VSDIIDIFISSDNADGRVKGAWIAFFVQSSMAIFRSKTCCLFSRLETGKLATNNLEREFEA